MCDQFKGDSILGSYKCKKHGTLHPHEQYKSGGICSRANGVVLNHFHVRGQKIERGRKWKCGHCNFEEEWQSNSTGQIPESLKEVELLRRSKNMCLILKHMESAKK
jgi:hypothetical protein